MRHRSATHHLGRNTEQRTSLFKNLLESLFTHGAIETTEAKAKAIQGRADKLIHRAQENTVATRRVLQRFFGTRQSVNLLVDQVAPALAGRVSGYTRIVKLGKRRGDDSSMVKIELVVRPLAKPPAGSASSTADAGGEIVAEKAARVSEKPVTAPKKKSVPKSKKVNE